MRKAAGKGGFLFVQICGRLKTLVPYNIGTRKPGDSFHTVMKTKALRKIENIKFSKAALKIENIKVCIYIQVKKYEVRTQSLSQIMERWTLDIFVSVGNELKLIKSFKFDTQRGKIIVSKSSQ